MLDELLIRRNSFIMKSVDQEISMLMIRSCWHDPPAAVMFDVLRSAERRNAGLGCAGALYWDAHSYIQLLEGPRDGLGALGAAILSDRRHTPLCWAYRPAPGRRLSPDLPLGVIDATEAAAMGLGREIRQASEAPADDRLLAAAAELVLELACRKYPAMALGAPSSN